MKKYLLIATVLISSVAKAQTGTGTTITGSFFSGTVSRTYSVYVPSIYYTANVAVPLVFNLHGLSGSAVAQANYQDFRTIADTANFIIVHPEGTGTGFSRGWGSMGTVAAGNADRVFLMSLLDTIESKYIINTNRIYTTGFSQGGFMSYNLACIYNSRFAAVASVAGSLSKANLAASNLVHPTPVMHIHGDTDALIAYTGNATYLHIDSLIKHWVCVNNCNPVPAIDTLANINTSDNCRPVHSVYTGGDDGSTVELYKIIAGGHQVPSDVTTANAYGIGNRNMDFKASKVIWEFFRKYSLNTLTSTLSFCSSSPTGLNEIGADENIRVYPNPSNGIFTVDLKNIQNADITIYNVLGEIVKREKITNRTTTINLGNIPSGVYFYQALNQTGLIKSGKLIIE